MRCVGLMSGTSMDAVDAVVLTVDEARAKLLATHAEPMPDALHDALLRLRSADTVTLDELGRLDVELGRLFARTALKVIADAGLVPADITAIGSHGQTVRHRPDGRNPFSLQLGDPNVIAELTGVVTVGDFRRRDIAAGGQGAPLAPAFHQWLLADRAGRCAVLNLGGIANLTLLEDGRLAGGFDTGPASTLLDAWHRRHRGGRYDDAGKWAADGRVDETLLAALLRHPYLERQPPKSTGFEDFSPDWLDGVLAALPATPAPQDVMATLAEFSVRTVAEALDVHWPGTQRLILCGGGARNLDLIARLRRWLPDTTLGDTASLGIPPDWIEAAAFAWLAHARLRGERPDLRRVTGSNHPVTLGGVY